MIEQPPAPDFPGPVDPVDTPPPDIKPVPPPDIPPPEGPPDVPPRPSRITVPQFRQFERERDATYNERSTASATRTSASVWVPTSCTEQGRPDVVAPHGSVIAGMARHIEELRQPQHHIADRLFRGADANGGGADERRGNRNRGQAMASRPASAASTSRRSTSRPASARA